MANYGRLDRLLHRLALGSDDIAEISFVIDQMMSRKRPGVADGHHVFVSGLARAGTTILMRRIHDSCAFRSLTYADMPFALAPNLWRMLRGGRTRSLGAAERAHGDGLMVEADSPESLDEIFWRVFDGSSYVGRTQLLPHEPDEDVLTRYRDYVGAILASGTADRYLSKNNNNILRLQSLQRIFPNAYFLIPFRHPFEQAASLLAQHKRFVEMHAADPFARDYMGWLVHHEFGADHRAFATHGVSKHAPDSLNYWIEQWLGVYRWMLENAPRNAIFIGYEDLCDDPRVWIGLADRLGIADDGASAITFTRRQPSRSPAEVSARLRDAAECLYGDLHQSQIDAAA
jgi:Sulfotransferase family